MSRRTRREQRWKNRKAEIKWAASLHGKLVQIKPPELKHTMSEAYLAKRLGAMGLAFAVQYGSGAMLRVLVVPGEFREMRWHLRKYVREASDEEMVMARLRSEIPDEKMLDFGQAAYLASSVTKEISKAIGSVRRNENRSNK